MPTVLVVDDNPSVATALEVLFSLRKLRTLGAESPAAALELLEREAIDLVIQDMNFSADTTSGEEGIRLFHELRRARPELPIILLTAWTQLETAVELVKAGAADYLAKPWDNRKLLASVGNLLDLSLARRELSRRRAGESRRQRELSERYDLRGLVFADAAMERAVAIACQVARADVPVLIVGPNGAGKEKIAEIVQANSGVKQGPFITLNCGALPSELLEAELFGAEAGAYTGATRARLGKFDAADGGTLFLDEIGNLAPAAQMKLLRVLETGRFEPLGSNREHQVAVRLVSATNADLPAMIRAGRFREDLYYRLNTIEIRVPPLSERRDDILPLAEHFLAAEKSARRTLSSEAREALLAHAWPGNVRELRNALKRASVLARSDEISAADLGLPSAPALSPEQLDRQTIELALARAEGVVAQAASELGLSRQALYRRMEKLGIARH
ncbi:MAG TPA: sigma-54 dependent transcriptional regulator [Polyangiaceae bacterium]|nr:sigma-54 dependent transcriptional regulator [Polyangiaceae bacterium]